MGFFDKFVQHISDTMLGRNSDLEEAEQNEDGSITLHIGHQGKEVEHTLTPQEVRNLYRRWEQQQ